MLSREATKIVFGLTRSGFEPMIYHTRGEHINTGLEISGRKDVKCVCFFHIASENCHGNDKNACAYFGKGKIVPFFCPVPKCTVHSRTYCGGSPSETDCLSCLTWSLQVFVDCTPVV
jgi:hypothetical protein